MSASPDADFVLWHALYSLEARYWYDVDYNNGSNAWRSQRGLATVRSLRTTRHLISNLWVVSASPREAKAFGVLSFHEASGRAPVNESKAPILVADIVNVCALDEGDEWRFKSHVLRPVFMGDDVPLSLAVDLTR